jgi:hypothetical protein
MWCFREIARSAHEEPEQDDDRNRNAEQPESNRTHWISPSVMMTTLAQQRRACVEGSLPVGWGPVPI